MKHTFQKGFYYAIFTIVLSTSMLLIGCEKENSKLDIPKDELITQIANSSYFKEFISVSKEQIKILNQNPNFQERIEFIIEQKNTDLLTDTEKKIQQNFLIQKADILAISKKWFKFNTLSKQILMK